MAGGPRPLRGGLRGSLGRWREERQGAVAKAGQAFCWEAALLEARSFSGCPPVKGSHRVGALVPCVPAAAGGSAADIAVFFTAFTGGGCGCAPACQLLRA